MYDVVVIGGGASGLIVASELSRNGRRVLLAEKNDRVGKKLLSTGNGRCNLANRDLSMERYHGSVLPIAEGIFQKYPLEALENYWASIGIDMVTLERGKMYPRSLQASSVLNALRRHLESSGCELMTDTEIVEIRPCQGGYLLKARIAVEREVTVHPKRNGMKDAPITKKVREYTEKKIKTEKVVLCAGGKASPAFGSNGEGAKLAKDLGMSIVPLRPAICRLLADSPYSKRLAGVRMEVPARLMVDKECVREIVEEVLFTEDGLSGPAILDLSRKAGDALEESRFVQISLDLAAEMEEGPLFRYLQERMERLAEWNMEDAMEGWMPKKMVVPVLNESGIDRTQIAGDLSKRQLSALIKTLKSFTMDIRGLDGFKEAQVTVGGIRGDQITEDLESKRCAGVFFTGEVLDLDGDCGGFNLMFAAASALTVVDALSM